MLLATYLKNRGITQAELARKAGTNQSGLSLFLCGRRGLSKKVALRVYSVTQGEVPLRHLLADPRRP